jgi:2-oxoglutarate dehydrogenase E1 component
MTPKSLLRHKRCVSKLSEFGPGTSFHRILHDDAQSLPGSTIALKPDDEDPPRRSCARARSITTCSKSGRSAASTMSTCCASSSSIPSRHARSSTELTRFRNADMVWAQEEPKNMGAWTFIEPNIEWVLGRVWHQEPRAPATSAVLLQRPRLPGQMSRHQAELKALLDDAFSL